MSPFRKFTAGVAAAVVVVLAAAGPASAHDELSSSSPAADERLETAPASVSLEFTADVMQVGALVMIADADGGDWAAGEPVVEYSTVTVPVEEGMPEGGYEVRWRVVSSDGHPISGVIPFTVGDAEPLQRPADAGADAGADDAASTAESEQQSQNTSQDGGLARVAVIGAVGAAVAVAAFAGIHFLRRRRSAGASDEPGN
ncbi:copper resistance CopC family protein [Microbacterium sp. zg.Y909]|uniref:copper resistance CopC family protein n=1 Tax=Microbacterium sp. zg.Y909 TaxID=2969413 RepID=UPI00214B782F|nr:copper resistance CopC family protein [Microbacterium sp. zg.Y909]MCR2827511.1 copper resistance protein CopC [Microbacterium sp. zg.Y909]